MIDILFLTHNRREFAEASYGTMLANTNWQRVSKLWFFDDRSTDGTKDIIRSYAAGAPCDAAVVDGRWGSPVDAMGEFIRRSEAPLLCKIDSDVMLPPHWLDDACGVLNRHHDVSILGIEARGKSSAESRPGPFMRTPDPSEWIGGIGFMRKSIFRLSDLPACSRHEGKWFGWQGWQIRNQERAKAAWIKPSLQVFLLDRMPMDPWRSLSEEYVRRGWQRKEPYLYGSEWAGLWSWYQQEAVCA